MKTSKPIRAVQPIRLMALGVAAASFATPMLAGGVHYQNTDAWHLADKAGSGLVMVAGEGESEGADRAATEADFLTALGFMQGHLRAGLALYQAGDLAAAKTHMGHPIKEKYEAVEAKLEQRGFGALKARIVALSDAAEAEAPVAEIDAKFSAVDALQAQVRAASPGGEQARLKSLAMLTRIAAEEYSAGVAGGTVSNLHEYQDSWGFLREVAAQAEALTASSDPEVMKAARQIGDLVDGLEIAYGDLQGKGRMQMDPDLIHGAAARMELAAIEAR